MATQIQTSCDICRKQKQEVNHWWMGVLSAGGSELKFVPWSPELINVAHYCGQSCAIKALSEWMQKGKG